MWHSRRESVTTEPPGPRGHPLLGNVAEIRRDPLAAYSRFARDYGDVVRIRFLRLPTYLIFHPDGVRHVLQEKHTNYSKDLFTYRLLKVVVGNGLVTNDGASWLLQRRLMQPAFHRARVASMGDMVVGACADMLERWAEDTRRAHRTDVSTEMTRIALQVAGQALFHVDLSRDAASVGRAFSAVNELLTDYVHAPIPPFSVPTPRNLRLRRARSVLDRYVWTMISDRRREGGDRGDLLSMLLAARDESTGEGMNDQQVRDELITLLFAGHETTANALMWATYLLAEHPEIQRRLRDEVTRTTGGGPPTSEHLPQLGYARMVLEETMRLYPPAWSFGRKSIEGDTIGGHPIPAHNLVWVCPYVTQRHPAFWERPDEFDPERFTSEKVALRHRFAHFPFGSGPRMCIGSHFAMMVTQLVLATVVQRFQLERSTGPAPEPQALLSLRPRHGVPVSLRPV